MKEKMKEFLDSLWKVIRVFLILFIVACILGIKHEMGRDNSSVMVIIGMVFIAIFLSAILIFIEILRYGHMHKCPHCNRWYALKKIGVTEAGSKDISVLTEVNTNQKERTKTGTQEQYIPNTRKYNHKNYIYKFCNKKSHTTFS